MANGRCAKCDKPVAHPKSGYCVDHRREYMREYQRSRAGREAQARADSSYRLKSRLDKKQHLAESGQLANVEGGFIYTLYYTIFYNDLRLSEELDPIKYRTHYRRAVKAMKFPACARWPITDEHQAVMNMVESSADLITALAFWQSLICAVCGRRVSECLDHNHDNGLIRGLLCQSCHAREGRSKDPAFVYYRNNNPASIFGLKFPWAIYFKVPEAKAVGEAVVKMLA